MKIDRLALGEVVRDSARNEARVIWFDIPPSTLAALSRHVDKHEDDGSPVHANYSFLTQYTPKSLPEDLLPLQDQAATALQKAGYNTEGRGVKFKPVFIYSGPRPHPQDGNADNSRKTTNPEALAKLRVESKGYVNRVPWNLIAPATKAGRSIILWPQHDPDKGPVESVAVHLEYGKCLMFRADVVHGGTMRTEESRQGAIHCKCDQVGGRHPTPPPAANYYRGPDDQLLYKTHLHRPNHMAFFGSHERVPGVGCDMVVRRGDPTLTFPCEGHANVPWLPPPPDKEGVLPPYHPRRVTPKHPTPSATVASSRSLYPSRRKQPLRHLRPPLYTNARHRLLLLLLKPLSPPLRRYVRLWTALQDADLLANHPATWLGISSAPPTAVLSSMVNHLALLITR